MKTASERIAKIAAARVQRDNAARLAMEEEMTAKMYYLDFIKSYGDRVKAILSIANELVKNGFPLGKDDSLASDMIRHNFGLIILGSTRYTPYNVSIYGIGYEGGGVCGVSHIVNENGVTSFGEYFYKHSSCKEWDEDFTAFEERFYKYVDSL